LRADVHVRIIQSYSSQYFQRTIAYLIPSILQATRAASSEK